MDVIDSKDQERLKGSALKAVDMKYWVHTCQPNSSVFSGFVQALHK